MVQYKVVEWNTEVAQKFAIQDIVCTLKTVAASDAQISFLAWLGGYSSSHSAQLNLSFYIMSIWFTLGQKLSLHLNRISRL